MIPASGQNSNGKIIKYRLPEYEGDENFKILTKRMVNALLVSIQPLEWLSRHIQLPSDMTPETLTDWTSDLRKRLLMDFDFCLHVAECIDNDDRVAEALHRFIESNYDIQRARPTSNEQNTENLDEGNNPECDLDLLYTKCKAVVHFTHLSITDTLQKVINALGVVDLAKSIWDSVPGLALVDDAAGADGVVQLVSYYRDAVIKNYEAQYTETPGGIEDEIAYALYCRCKGDCSITIDRIVATYRKRLSLYTSPPSLAGLVNLLETLAGIESDTTFIVDLSHYVAWGTVKVASLFFGAQRFATGLLKLMLKMVDEGEEDLEDMIEFFGDCPIEWEFTIDFVTGENVEYVDIIFGTHVLGEGLHSEFVDGGGGANSYNVVAFNWTTLPENILTGFTAESEYESGILQDTNDSTWYLKWGDMMNSILEPATPVFPIEWEGSAAGNSSPSQGVGVIAGATLAGNGNPGGSVLFKKIILRGEDTVPVI